MSNERDSVRERLDTLQDFTQALSLDLEATKRRIQYEGEQQSRVLQKYGRYFVVVAFVVLLGAVVFELLTAQRVGWWVDTVSSILLNLFTELFVVGILVLVFDRHQAERDTVRRQREAIVEDLQRKAMKVSTTE
jgi:hypothetical protein